jgi:hypothetical protein
MGAELLPREVRPEFSEDDLTETDRANVRLIQPAEERQ